MQKVKTLYRKAKTNVLLCAGLILFFLSSCASTKVEEPKPQYFYPPPPTQEELEYKATHFNDGTKIVTKET
ncbi:MAG: hypothetical protein II461_06380, partial [Treponema sp.]|nr:hypothetical protein [Treponema sp.]